MLKVRLAYFALPTTKLGCIGIGNPSLNERELARYDWFHPSLHSNGSLYQAFPFTAYVSLLKYIMLPYQMPLDGH